MNLLVIGNGRQAYVASSLFASVGNNVVLLTSGQYVNSVMKEPELARLYEQQMSVKRLEIKSKLNSKLNSKTMKFDFVLLAELSLTKFKNKYFESIIPSLKDDTCFIILSPSDIGETREFSQSLLSISHNIRACCVPLLVREGRAINDFSRPEVIIVGCDEVDVLPKVNNLFYPFNRNKNVIKSVSSKEAEFSSFATSAMLATRLSFMNEMASLAERSGVDIDTIRVCIGSDPRIGLDYLYPGCGYGGRALNENVDKIAKKLQSRSDDLGLLSIVKKINERQKDILFRKIWNYFQSNLKDKTIAVWGASFKPGSSSIKGAPAIRLIESHLAQEGKIQVYDPAAKEPLLAYFKNRERIIIVDSLKDSIKGADVLAICTEWKEFWSPDFELLVDNLTDKAIFDGRNILNENQVKQYGLRYFGIGRGEQI